MKKTLLLVLLACCFSCKKADPYPNAKTARGSIDATISGKKWPDPNHIVQVYSVKQTQEYLTRFPCANDVLSVMIVAFGHPEFSHPEGDLRSSYSFRLPLKVGKYVPNKYPDENLESGCVGLPFSGILSFLAHGSDALEGSYTLAENPTNLISISSITPTQVTGSFDLHLVRVVGGGSSQYPDDNGHLHLVCKQFIAER
jgi:hypothetical protein